MNTPLPKRATPLAGRKPRILAFDLARGLCILCMMIIHTLDFYGAPEVHETVVGTSFKALVGWPAGSIFIFIMGVFIAYTPNTSLSQGLTRAASLFVLGYVLNFFRGTLPMWLSLQFGLVTYEELGPHSPLTEFLVVDILQFAGIAFAVCCLLQHYLANPKYWLLVALIVNFTSPLMWGISSSNWYFDEFLQLFWGNEIQGVVFPQFPWLTYPIVGMAFGHWLKQSENANVFFKKAAWTGAMTMLAGLAVIATDPEFHLADSMRAGPGVVIGIVAFTILIICLSQLLTKEVPHNPLFSVLYTWSKYVTVIYVIQWLLIGWGLMIFGLQTLGTLEVLSAMVGVIVLSDLLMRAWVKLTLSRPSKPTELMTVKSNS